MTTIQLCRTCLANDTPMYTIANTHLQMFYEKITNKTLNTNDRKPSAVCYICYHLLKKCLRFAERAVRADDVLQQMCRSGNQITEHYIIDRRSFSTCLKSPVTHVNTIHMERSEHENIAVSASEFIDDNQQEETTQYEIKIDKIEIDDTQYHPHSSGDDVSLQNVSIKKENEATEMEIVPETSRLSCEEFRRRLKNLDQTQIRSSGNLERHSSSKEDRLELDCEDKNKHSNKKNPITKRKSFKCDCGKWFRNESIFQNHLYAHTRDMMFACNSCDFKCTKKKDFIYHVRKTHTGKNLFTCNYCEKEFTESIDLNKHLRIHTAEKLFQCMYCERMFLEKNYLKNHLRTHTGEKPFTCDYCGKKFALRSTFRSHVKIHDGNRKQVTCDQCGKGFWRQEALKTHLTIHTGEKPFACDYCGRSFRIKTFLIGHIRTHTGERPYKCTICGKKFALQGAMTQHFKKMHA